MVDTCRRYRRIGSRTLLGAAWFAPADPPLPTTSWLTMIRQPIFALIGTAFLAVLATRPAAAQIMTVELVADGFNRPLFVTSTPDPTDTRLFVLEQNTARIRIIKDGQVLGTPFLDLGSEASSGGERGLLGMAFHPDYSFPTNRRFFVNFTNNSGNTRVWQFKVDPGDEDQALGNHQNIQAFSQPFSNHNGGSLQFGADGMLYISTGDGGSANDPGNRAQDLTTRLGKMLRLDIDLPPPFIPPDNPFVGMGGGVREEIWAYGLRNPWRFSFDRQTGDMYIGDVGQGAREEVSFQAAASAGGENYGWRCMEGFNCTGLSGCTCDDVALTDPIHEYTHGGGNCSITGGYMYRGPSPALQGLYFFADFCSDRIWTFEYDGVNLTNLTDRTAELDPPGPQDIESISSFGEDSLGNLYIVDHADGEIWRVKGCESRNFCQTSPNSADPVGAIISSSGSHNLTDNAFVLNATSGVPDQFGFFFYGDDPVQVPLGDGFRCAGGNLFRILPPLKNDGNGDVALAVDLNAPPFTGAGAVVSGTTYYFQHWFRDPAAAGAGFNFTDGLQVVFCP